MDDQLSLPHDVYTRLLEAAESEGTTPVGWIQDRLPPPHDQRSSSLGTVAAPQNMLEALGDLVGSIHSGGQLQASERHGELFAEGMEEKRRQGRL
jgi:hypothetical protein